MNVHDSWLRASPFKTKTKLKEIIKKYKQGEKIGFTYTSSLKSMGIIPRSDGEYKIGQKYKNLSN